MYGDGNGDRGGDSQTTRARTRAPFALTPRSTRAPGLHSPRRVMVLLRQAMQAHRLLLWIRNRHSRPI